MLNSICTNFKPTSIFLPFSPTVYPFITSRGRALNRSHPDDLLLPPFSPPLPSTVTPSDQYVEFSMDHTKR